MIETEKLIERMMDFIDDDYVSYFPMNNNTKKRPVNKNTFNNVNKKKISVVDEAAHNFIEELCFKLKEKTQVEDDVIDKNESMFMKPKVFNKENENEEISGFIYNIIYNDLNKSIDLHQDEFIG